jgi:hypothetical protein
MASEAAGSAPLDKQVVESSSPKQGDVSRDVEVGHEAVDIERIERVYAYVLRELVCGCLWKKLT